MCNGDVIELSCGHSFVHYTKKCGRRCPKPKGTRRYLADTCSRCDSEYRASEESRELKEKTADVMKRLLELVEQRESEKAAEATSELDGMRKRANSAIGEAQHRRGSALDVEYPDRRREPSGTSQWINGKCVWTRENPRIPYKTTRPPEPPKLSAEEAAREMREERKRLIASGRPNNPPPPGLVGRKKPLSQRKLDRLIYRNANVWAYFLTKDGLPEGWDAESEPEDEPEPEQPERSQRPAPPPHPLRHKKKYAPWLLTPEEADALAGYMAEVSLEEPGAEGEYEYEDGYAQDESSGENHTPYYTTSSGESYAIGYPGDEDEGEDDIWLREADRG
ncbi:hypothetical protein DL762_001393 [Monosporascus cannonballus]|uniref:Uncharacterized protein n=1 Tax=Monosporascus cannonballus TaxID=155416 RepID=A0ABY0HKS8_9PEZI|nr:hypothetical protein DL762_001393 [Monosporascus cannonballus]RYP00994.1 hypothetical protein DL763_000415 [Monosporascus cannonballus]